jgi:hypothetical protein
VVVGDDGVERAGGTLVLVTGAQGHSAQRQHDIGSGRVLVHGLRGQGRHLIQRDTALAGERVVGATGQVGDDRVGGFDGEGEQRVVRRGGPRPYERPTCALEVVGEDVGDDGVDVEDDRGVRVVRRDPLGVGQQPAQPRRGAQPDGLGPAHGTREASGQDGIVDPVEGRHEVGCHPIDAAGLEHRLGGQDQPVVGTPAVARQLGGAQQRASRGVQGSAPAGSVTRHLQARGDVVVGPDGTIGEVHQTGLVIAGRGGGSGERPVDGPASLG